MLRLLIHSRQKAAGLGLGQVEARMQELRLGDPSGIRNPSAWTSAALSQAH